MLTHANCCNGCPPYDAEYIGQYQRRRHRRLLAMNPPNAQSGETFPGVGEQRRQRDGRVFGGVRLPGCRTPEGRSEHIRSPDAGRAVNDGYRPALRTIRTRSRCLEVAAACDERVTRRPQNSEQRRRAEYHGRTCPGGSAPGPLGWHRGSGSRGGRTHRRGHRSAHAGSGSRQSPVAAATAAEPARPGVCRHRSGHRRHSRGHCREPVAAETE